MALTEARGQKEPAGQGRHAALELLPALGLYVPAGQLVHDGAPPVLYSPSEQERHAALELLPVAGLKVPAAHCVQAAAPALDHEPAGQMLS